jgi:uncharacterized protein YggU (UPF0235/DUF167 family)
VLVAWRAGELGLARRDVTLLRGQSSRRKSIAIDAPEARLIAWLRRTLSGSAAP